MAYQTGSATNIEDLMDDLRTFLTSNGWTQDEWDTVGNSLTVHRTTDLYISASWDDTTGTDLALYQSLGFTPGNDPWNHPSDSGNGDATYPINSSRRVNFLSAGPYTAYHFFASTSAPYYCHVVVEVSSGRFRHFGFGELNKFGDWDGGEYCYGHLWNQTAAAIDDPASTLHSIGLDGLYATAGDQATVHMEGFAFQGASERWGCCAGLAAVGTDRAGNARQRLHGTVRAGLWPYALAWLRASTVNAYKPLMPIHVMRYDQAATPDTSMLLGVQPDACVINMGSLNAGDELTIGSDTWMVFPWVRKQYLLANTEETWQAGLAYKKIV